MADDKVHSKGEKTPVYKKWWCWTIIVLLGFVVFGPTSSDTDSTQSSQEHKISHGELLSEIETCTEYDDDLQCQEQILVIKAKITKSYNNGATVSQNYHNVANYIKSYVPSAEKYKEIQYWAVADMMDGKEGKTISFTVKSDVVGYILNDKIVATTLEDYLEDLWILPSLKDD